VNLNYHFISFKGDFRESFAMIHVED